MDYDFIAIDFETANSYYSSACSVGLTAIKDFKIVDKYYSLIKPIPYYFDEKNSEVNGLTEEDIKDAPTFPDVWQEIKNYFTNTTIIAHNAYFDMEVLKNCLVKNNLKIPEFEYMDSISISSRACFENGINTSLESRAKYLGIDIGTHHNALNDSIVCAEIVNKTIIIRKKKSFNSFKKIFTSIPVKNFYELEIKEGFSKHRKKFQKICISEIACMNESIDITNEFYSKNVVFTGELKSMDRKDAMQKVINMGALVKSGVSSKTDYLIVGVQDKSLVGEDGMSTKEEKAYDLIKKGKEIKVLNEEEFLKLL